MMTGKPPPAEGDDQATLESLMQQNAAQAAANAALTAELAAVNQELQTFEYSVSHDLRAPLRSIDGFSLALEEEFGPLLSGSGLDYLQRVRGAAQRMTALIDGLLSLSRVGRAELRRTNVDLTILADAAAADLRSAHSGRDVTFVRPEGMAGRGDPRLLRVVVENLLDNAWKFTSRREAARVELGFTQDNGEPAYFVRDNGAGFDMAYGERLFGAFQRLHKPTDFPGTGMGLATVKRIVNRHGGRVWAEGEVDSGATFYFTLGQRHE
jgi:light-regulated signal transduction histidine kinase (bacteriophytochrome)